MEIITYIILTIYFDLVIISAQMEQMEYRLVIVAMTTMGKLTAETMERVVHVHKKMVSPIGDAMN